MLHDYGPDFDIDPHSPPPVNEVGSECILCDLHCKGSKASELEVAAIREKLKEKLSILCAHVNQCSSTVALLSAKSHVTSAISIIKSLNHTTTEIKLPYKTGPELSKKNVTPHGRFFQLRTSSSAPLFSNQNHQLKKRTNMRLPFKFRTINLYLRRLQGKTV